MRMSGGRESFATVERFPSPHAVGSEFWPGMRMETGISGTKIFSSPLVTGKDFRLGLIRRMPGGREFLFPIEHSRRHPQWVRIFGLA